MKNYEAAFRIDLVRGNITSHWTMDGERTICGKALGMSQRYLGNIPCKRCEKMKPGLDDPSASD